MVNMIKDSINLWVCVKYRLSGLTDNVNKQIK